MELGPRVTKIKKYLFQKLAYSIIVRKFFYLTQVPLSFAYFLAITKPTYVGIYSKRYMLKIS